MNLFAWNVLLDDRNMSGTVFGTCSVGLMLDIQVDLARRQLDVGVCIFRGTVNVYVYHCSAFIFVQLAFKTFDLVEMT